jgi:hypothetical protein
MDSHTSPAAARGGRRIPRALRSLSPGTAAALALALVLGGTGLASAANGGGFILGSANTETATASLANSKGTPLSLSAPSGKAPFAVNRNVQVSNLNAQFTGGLSSAQLQATGGDGVKLPNSDIFIDRSGERVTQTGPLPAGTYYVTASALLNVSAGDKSGICWLARASEPTAIVSSGGENHEGLVQAAETAAMAVQAGDSLVEMCQTSGSGSIVFNAGITAVRILSSHGDPPA